MKTILLVSKEVKRLLLKRLDELGTTLSHVADKANVSYDNLKKSYINLGPGKRCGIKEEDLIRVLKVLGVEAKITLCVTPKEDMDIEKLKSKADARPKDGKKTGAAGRKRRV